MSEFICNVRNTFSFFRTWMAPFSHLDFVRLKPDLNPYYEACPKSKDTKVLNMYNIFNLQKRHCK